MKRFLAYEPVCFSTASDAQPWQVLLLDEALWIDRLWLAVVAGLI
jgi:hypothetical protein